MPASTPTPNPNPTLIDTHAHLADPKLLADLDGVLERARDSGLSRIIAVGTTADDSRDLLDLAESRRGVFATVGIHPNHAAEASDGDWDRVIELLRRPEVAALGETGLDRYWDKAPFPLQQDYFDRHLSAAFERGLPVIIHCRESENDIIAQLRALKRPVTGVLHSFTGTIDQARAFLDLGLHISFAGQITFTNKALDGLRAASAFVPIDRLLVETDSPYLSPHPHRGKLNEPARVAFTARRVAEVRAMAFEDLAGITTENARRLFQLDDDANVLGHPDAAEFFR